MKIAWPLLSLTEAGVSLLDCDHRTPPAASDGYPYVAIPQIKDGRLDLSDVRRISKEHFVDWTKKTCPKANDVIVVRRCSPGDSAHVPLGIEFALGQNLVLLRSNGTRIAPEFLRWLVRGPTWREQVQRFLNVGAVFDSLKCREIPNFRLHIPPKDQQLRIAEVLGSLDEKIELNHRMNRTLETMAQALFRSWFVDFEPVRAKAEGRQPVGMDAETAALFSSKLVESDLGNIPEGLIIRRLGDILELKRGYDLPSSQRIPGTVPVVSSSGPSGWHNEPKVHGPGIVTGRYGSIGEVFLVREDFWPLNTTLYVKDLKGNDIMYAYHLLRLLDFNKFSDKAAVPGINRNHLHEERLVAAPLVLQERFSKLTTPLLELAAKNTVQTTTLVALRDTLLPKLLSGEIRVREAAAEVAASA